MREAHHHSRPFILNRAKQMRKESAPAERLLWSRIRSGRLNSLKFRRQQPIGDYIVDYFCPIARLVIELDGDSHFNSPSQEYDGRRTQWLVSQQLKVIRFTNTDVFENLDSVLEEILRHCEMRSGPELRS